MERRLAQKSHDRSSARTKGCGIVEEAYSLEAESPGIYFYEVCTSYFDRVFPRPCGGYDVGPGNIPQQGHLSTLALQTRSSDTDEREYDTAARSTYWVDGQGSYTRG